MYRYLDRTAASLTIGERFLLWAMRNWAQAVGRRRCPCHALAAGFARWNAGRGLQPFSMAMAVLHYEAKEGLCFNRPGHARIAEDEALLLTLFVSVGERARVDFRETLGLIVPMTSTAALHIAIEAAATAFDAAGLHMSTAVGPDAPKGNFA